MNSANFGVGSNPLITVVNLASQTLKGFIPIGVYRNLPKFTATNLLNGAMIILSIMILIVDFGFDYNDFFKDQLEWLGGNLNHMKTITILIGALSNIGKDIDIKTGLAYRGGADDGWFGGDSNKNHPYYVTGSNEPFKSVISDNYLPT